MGEAAERPPRPGNEEYADQPPRPPVTSWNNKVTIPLKYLCNFWISLGLLWDIQRLWDWAWFIMDKRLSIGRT